MQNFSMEAQFRPVVNPDRKLKQLPTGKDTPFEEVQQFVDHLHSSVPHGKDKKNSKKEKKSSSSLSSSGDAKDDSAARTLRIEKGRKVEMHLDVIAGDTIRWEFISRSSDFCFVATYFHEVQQQPVCRTDGVKNMAIAGAFEIEFNGSFVLMWQNTQKGFTIDRNGIKITYDVVHTRAAVDEPPVNATFAAAGHGGTPQVTLPETQEGCDEPETIAGPNGAVRLTDDQKCEVFRQPDHIRNPITTTTAFVDYFKLTDVSNKPEKSATSTEKKKSSFFKMFDDKKHQQASTASTSRRSGSITTNGVKNTFRSLTLLPTTRRVRKDFEAKVVMTENFPFQLRDFLPVIQFISTTGDHVKNLEEFFQMVRIVGDPSLVLCM
ncbi:hypothetical protein PHYSODRAFT_472103 [Phytophthora sojae]|uniref:Ankyrin repeat domain-containing protein n=1 Tax=Phytophthora sojae (strain P6497) TaxID=1094619 RepID=G4YPW8_PHYSP|nr:hypothetical protein PHYSODRAFT_472103 [Phytophthora sojae]EGZ28963.1 hypothetical protein PHYSODRAFT_472103 [Phytophthora sojae]|eukprot:XP_009516238.1 hypothetical protein PHYSODRAFT_472103 [Phytophthora sojae]